MFEETNNQQNPTQNSNEIPKVSGLEEAQPPQAPQQNLATQFADSPLPSKKMRVDDIFAEVDEVGENDFEGIPKADAKSMEVINNFIDDDDKSNNKWNYLIIILVLVILIAVGVIFKDNIKTFVQSKFSSQPTTIEENNITIPQENKDNVSAQVEQTSTTKSSTQSENTQNTNDANIDSDKDGLTDKEEKELGTNVLKMDSDDDGLTDYEEVKSYKTNPFLLDSDGDGLLDKDEIQIYKSNPNNVDTDGDSYWDGEEVKNGFNPIGSGKLLK